MATVSVLGLGTMGGRIAAELVRAGHQVRGFDPVETMAEQARANGVEVTADAAGAVEGAELVVLSLPRPDHVLAAATGPLRAATGAVVADLSTIDPGTARSAATDLAAHGVDYLDAPVLGRPAKIGTWTLPVGGDQDVIVRASDLLVGPVAARVIRVGDVGAGSTVKLMNNLMFGAINAVTAEALTICQAAGVDPATFVGVVADSGAATVSNLFRELAPKLVASDYSVSFALALLDKDNRLALEVADQVGADAPIAALLSSLHAAALDQGLGEDDTGAIQELYRARGRQ